MTDAEAKHILDDVLEAICERDPDASLYACLSQLDALIAQRDVSPAHRERARDYRRQIEALLHLNN